MRLLVQIAVCGGVFITVCLGQQVQEPSWARDAIFYQIFPERFANGDTTNDPPDVQPWGGKPMYNNYFGGDLQGIIDHLDYLQTLGINAIYMTPIFESPTNHKYQTIDYLKIDPHFGDEKLFHRLIDECHKRGLRVVIDGVFNHTSVKFFAFDDLKKNGKNSQYTSWYNVHSYPVSGSDKPNYDGWWGHGDLPKLMTDTPAVRTYLFNVTKHWTEAGIDGWRVDAAEQISHDFWNNWRTVVKKENPNAFIIGEIWTDASAWLAGDEFDAVMNYPFRGSLVGYVALENRNARQFDSILVDQQHRYAPAVVEVLQNLIGSHDTERFLTLCKGDIDKLKTAVLVQMTYPGAPMIYYGDEIGMTGGKDPDCRKTMIWDQQQWNMDLFHWYQRMIKIRKTYDVFRNGSYSTAFVDSATNSVGYWRASDSAQALVVINGSAQQNNYSLAIKSTFPTKWINLVDDKEYNVRADSIEGLSLGAHSAAVLVPAVREMRR
ncbi:MAG TPA: glycoside hydrolase family 13 protein [Bacteroidota bacterium]|nr:glycoside hydrolase family 13 protein [Bacteroidota bacterium]